VLTLQGIFQKKEEAKVVPELAEILSIAPTIK
jgi:hypothetical protein